MEVSFDNLEKNTLRKQKLEQRYSSELGYKIKILSDASYMEEMLEMYCGPLDTYSFNTPKIGEKVKGKIVGENSKFILVDINYKDNIYIEKKGRELDVLKSLELKEDQDIELLITSIDDDTYEIRGSVASILVQNARKTVETGLLENSAFDGYIKEFNPAGYFVQLQIGQTKIDSFMPKTLAGINKLPEPDSIVGQTLKVMIENKTQEGFIVSRKKYLKTLIKEQIELLEHNTVYHGFVTGTTDFGIFVEFNECLTGMIHKANVNPVYNGKLHTIVPGTPIDFYVKEIIKDKYRGAKIILTQILKETLWDTIKIGDKLNGTIKSIKSFGVLLQLDEGTVGLVHISELEKANKAHVEPGDELDVEVISVQRSERKIFLAPY